MLSSAAGSKAEGGVADTVENLGIHDPVDDAGLRTTDSKSGVLKGPRR